MILSLLSSLGAGAVLISLVSATTDPQLTGTWTTKSRSVITGPVSAALYFAMPIFRCFRKIEIQESRCMLEFSKTHRGQGFYDPVNERIFEPVLTGFSYSFTDDGHYEEAYYRAVSNRVLIADLGSLHIISDTLLKPRTLRARKVLCNGSTANTRRTRTAPSP